MRRVNVTLRALHTLAKPCRCSWERVRGAKRVMMVVVVVVMRVMMHMALQSTSLLGGMQKRPAVQI